MGELVSISYPLAIVVVIAFGTAACIYHVIRQRRQGKPDTAEFFLTARGTVTAFTIGWSFYAASMGSWALFGPPSYALVAGITGVISYAISCGFPIFVLACFGSIIHRRMPNIMSFTDYVERRFGLLVSLYVTGLLLFNMTIALTGEYTAVGDLFEYVIGANRIPIVLVIAVVSMLYTAWGGLLVSIITDQWQAMTSVVFVLILFIYVWATFDAPLGPLPDNLKADSYFGLASIGVQPIAITCGYLFGESIWQRCWAPESSRALIYGAAGASIAVSTAVFLLGFGGLLAAWGNVWVPSGPDDFGNTVLFALLNKKTWITTLVTILAVTMSESAIDSYQNAIVNTISSRTIAFFPKLRDSNLNWIRIVVIVINVPPILISLTKVSILQLYLLISLICTTSCIPIMLGIIHGPKSRMFITPFSAIFGCLTALASLFCWTRIKQADGQSYKAALHVTFMEAYDYPPFFIAAGMSVVGLTVGAFIEFLFRETFPGFKEYPLYELSGPKPQSSTELPTKYVDENDASDESGFKEGTVAESI